LPDTGFTRLAIINRGEAAMRLIRAVRELNLEHDLQIATIALHTAAERRATFVLEADEAVQIGGSASPYLDHAELERALRSCRAVRGGGGGPRRRRLGRLGFRRRGSRLR